MANRPGEFYDISLWENFSHLLDSAHENLFLFIQLIQNLFKLILWSFTDDETWVLKLTALG